MKPKTQDKNNSNTLNEDIQKRPFDQEAIYSTNGRVGIHHKGGYLSSWQVMNPKTGLLEDVSYTGSLLKRTGFPILFPYYGKADGMKQHGFGRESSWTISEKEKNAFTMTLTSELISADARLTYEHLFAAQIHVELEEDGSLVYDLHVENTGTAALPITPGLHPYFSLLHSDKKKITIDGIKGFDATKTPWDTIKSEEVFPYTGKTTLNIPGKEISIEDITKGGKVVKYIIVWSQAKDAPDKDFICVEPVCGGDNDIHQNPIVVAPGKDWRMTLRFSCKFV